jgi:hypothetical protein
MGAANCSRAKEADMLSQKTFSLIAGLIFSLIAVGHLLRLVYSWPMQIAGWTAPLWASWAGLLVAGFLGISGLALSRKS